MGYIKEYHYHHNEDTIFYGNNHNNSVPYFGVELEVDEYAARYSDYHVDKADNCAKSVSDILGENFVYFEEDGSLNNGFEIITQPATLQNHLEKCEDYKEAFKKIVRCGFTSHKCHNCGLHVHFNRSFFTEGHSETEVDLYITRLLYLVEKFWEEIYIFSRRRRSDLDHYASRYDDAPEEVVRKTKNCFYLYGRYHAVNLTNENTIEFRMFRGSLNIETFFATLEFCQNLVMTAKNVESAQEIQNVTWDDLMNTERLKAYWERVKQRRQR